VPFPPKHICEVVPCHQKHLKSKEIWHIFAPQFIWSWFPAIAIIKRTAMSTLARQNFSVTDDFLRQSVTWSWGKAILKICRWNRAFIVPFPQGWKWTLLNFYIKNPPHCRLFFHPALWVIALGRRNQRPILTSFFSDIYRGKTIRLFLVNLPNLFFLLQTDKLNLTSETYSSSNLNSVILNWS